MVGGAAKGIEHYLFYFLSPKADLTRTFQVHETILEGSLVVAISAIHEAFFQV